MSQGLIVLGVWIVTVITGCTIFHFKGNHSTDKIEIMSVRSELKKIDKLNKADKESLF